MGDCWAYEVQGSMVEGFGSRASGLRFGVPG